ncbi:MAG: ankyrin repeat domain-containing protein [bacterium]|nr:ankyrin repeat domain-containing protein [bacterium]
MTSPALQLEQFLDLAARGHDQGVRNMLAAYPNLAKEAVADKTIKQVHGTTALHLAAFHGHVKVMEILLAAGADIHARNIVGETPLLVATSKRHVHAVEWLLEKGADANLGNDQLYTPLMSASHAGCADCAEALIKHGAVVNAVNKELQSALHYVIWANNDAETQKTIRVLLAHGMDETLRDKMGNTALDEARHMTFEIETGLESEINVVVEMRAETVRKKGVENAIQNLKTGAGSPLAAPRTATFKPKSP